MPFAPTFAVTHTCHGIAQGHMAATASSTLKTYTLTAQAAIRKTRCQWFGTRTGKRLIAARGSRSMEIYSNNSRDTPQWG